MTRRGLPTVRLDVTLIDCWESGDSRFRRQPVIDAVRTRQVTATSLRDIALRSPRLRGRAELLQLLDLLDGGCQSELEIAGHLKVFTHRSLPTSRRQWPVIVYGQCYLLDVAWPELMLAVELAGAAYHGSRKQRERDVRRDAGLPAAGWQVIRVTHTRLSTDPAGVRTELAVIIGARRAQLSAVERA